MARVWKQLDSEKFSHDPLHMTGQFPSRQLNLLRIKLKYKHI
jgi:hypothetical protein